jgi:alpha-1,3-rhamnosyltransferase
MLNSQPLVSVIIPSYNHEAFIATCIRSVFSQDYLNFEVIVIDDGSTDNSREILAKLHQEYDFKLILQENHGLSFTLNRGIQGYSKGKYITLCSSDDFWLEGKLNKQVKFLEENHHIPMVFGKSKIIDFNGNYLEDQTIALNHGLKGGYIFKEIFLQDFHPPVNYMYRSDIFNIIGLFDPEAWAEDFDMNLRIACKFPIGYLDEFIYCYRRGENSSSTHQPYKIINSHRYSIEKYATSKYYSEAVKRWHYRNFIWYSSRKKTKLFALKSMILSLSLLFHQPFQKGIRDLLLRWY